MARPRGTGSLYQQKGSAVWWVKYYRAGIPYRESTHTTDRQKAEKFLRRRQGEIATNNFYGPSVERVKMSELAEDFIRDYRINERKSLDDAEARWNKHLKPFFSNWRAVQVGSELIARFVDQRQKEGAKNATINRELACLKRMFKLGQQASPPKVYRTPPFPMLKERNVRLGFVEDAQYDNLAAACAEEGLWLRAMFEVGYTYGWRHSEVLNMRVEQVNLLSRSIRLEPGTTKNDRGRQVQMTPAVHALLSQCISGKQSRDYVFTRTDGKRIRDFRGAWWNACIRAGLGHFVCKVCSTATETRRSCETCKAEGRATNRLDLRYQGLLFHDLRRTAARNFRRAGVAEGVIMKIGGWLTRTVFDRYAIVSQSDLTDAVSKLQTHRQSTLPENGHDFGHTDAEPVSVAERRNIN